MQQKVYQGYSAQSTVASDGANARSSMDPLGSIQQQQYLHRQGGKQPLRRGATAISILSSLKNKVCMFIFRYWKYMASFKIMVLLLTTWWGLVPSINVIKTPLSASSAITYSVGVDPIGSTLSSGESGSGSIRWVTSERCRVPRKLNASDTAVIYLQKPRARFHGNHWFHIGEYYLSRHKQLQELIGERSHVRIVAHEAKVSSMMTRFPFFLIVLAAMHDKLQSVEIFNPIRSMESLSQQAVVSSHEVDTPPFTTTAPLYIAFHSPEGPRLIYKRSVSDPMQRFTSLSDPMIIVHRAYKSQQYSKHIEQQVQLEQQTAQFSAKHNDTTVNHFASAVAASTDAVAVSKGCVEGQLVGAVGPAPINTSYWFRSEHEVRSIRNNAAMLCSSHSSAGVMNSIERESGINSVSGSRDVSISSIGSNSGSNSGSSSGSSGSKLKLIIYQRNINRLFLNITELHWQIQRGLSNPTQWDISILQHDEDFVPCALYQTINSADLLVTAHGFQLTALIFMKPGAAIVEIFPYKYFRKTYFPLSTQFGIHHFWTQNISPTTTASSVLRWVSQESCMSDLLCRSYARSMDISMPAAHLQLVLSVAHDIGTGVLGVRNLPHPRFKR